MTGSNRVGLSVVRGYDAEKLDEAVSRHPAGKSEVFRALEDLKTAVAHAKHEEMRAHLASIQGNELCKLNRDIEDLHHTHETQRALLEYRIAGGTLEGLGDLADNEGIEDTWTYLEGEFDL